MDVGYKVRFAKKNPKSNVIFMTEGTFINELISKNESNLDYDFVILDEIHERNARVDLIMAMLKTIKCKTHYILMSATVDSNAYIKYFNAHLIQIKGLGYKAEIIYAKNPVENYLIQSFLTVKEIVSLERDKAQTQNEIDNIFNDEKMLYNRDVLIFVPGEEDIHELSKMLKNLPDVTVHKIFASLSDCEQNLIFEETDKIKVIVSTNICETSLTIPGIKYVIDTGLQKEKIYKGVSYFGIKPIGRDNADQRLGRCNRTDHGICFRLYTEDSYKKMRSSIPEILKTDLSFILLFLLHYGIDLIQFEFLTFPSKENVRLSLEYLLCIKAINLVDNKICILNYGNSLLQYPLDTNLAHFYKCCINYKVEKLGAIIISFISQTNCTFFDIDINRKRPDLDELLLLFKNYGESNDKYAFCGSKNINIKYMEKSMLIFNQLQGGIESIDYSQLPVLKKAFLMAFNHNTSIRTDKNIYRNVRLSQETGIHPSNYFFRKNIHKMVYVDIWCMNKNYARIIEMCDSY